MDIRLDTFVQNAIILSIVLYVCSKTYPNRKNDAQSRMFNLLAFSTASLQFFSTIIRLFKNTDLLPIPVQYIIFILMFISMAFPGCYAFQYLFLVYDKEFKFNKFQKTMIYVPCVILILASLSSVWTHWIFYIDSSFIQHRGTMFFLQIVCPYSYFLICLIFVLKTYALKDNHMSNSKMIRYYIIYLVPTTIGITINLFMNLHAEGYSQIGASVSMILLYLELYVDEIKETERLRGVDRFNQQLQKKNEEIEKAMGVLEGISQEYHTLWIINRNTLEMTLVRTKTDTTIFEAVETTKELKYYQKAYKAYAETYVDESDYERFLNDASPTEIFKHIDNSKEIYNVDFLRKTPDGRVSHHQLAFSDATTETGIRQFVLGFRDIDHIVKEEQARNQELEQAKNEAELANAAKTSFLFNMSHDIRTPMNAIIGFTDLLQKHQDEPERRENYIRKIRNSSNVLLSIINNVLEMARIEKGTIALDESAWSIEQFIDSMYSIHYEMMNQKGIEFTYNVQVKDGFIYCDPIKLREIMQNILSNAYKYTNTGGKVHMQVNQLDYDKEGYALIQTAISDTGIGMSEEFLPKIFDEFSREYNTTDNKIEGTGLGMPIVKRLVQLMNGTIEVESKKNEGSKFTITIPHRLADRSTMVDHAGVIVDSKLFEDKRILLAEDNDLNAEIAMEILSEAGFKIDRAEDGIQVIDMLKNAPANYYSIILMDIQMPRMNGYEATKEIRELSDSTKSSIPILAMTANAFEEDKKAAYNAGMNGHLAKPINVQELMRELSRKMI